MKSGPDTGAYGMRDIRPAKRAVRAVNDLTARWAATHEGGDTVFSAAGVWPLLALLAEGAGGPARRELEEAVRLPAGEAAAEARGLLTALAGMRGVDTALGLWTRASLPLHEAWTTGLPAGAHALLSGDKNTDQAALDAWASEHTGGLVKSMPVAVDEATLLVLASALALRTEWYRPFEDGRMCPWDGPWAGITMASLNRTSALLDRVGVADTPAGALTVARVLGDTGIDVHLLLGEPGVSPGRIIAAGTDVLAGRHHAVPADALPNGDVGPGVTKGVVKTLVPSPPRLSVTTVPFALGGDHNLLDRAELFGLATAKDENRGHFPGISPVPLAVRSARQSSVAEFGALGFRAASVTAISAGFGGMPPEPRHRSLRVSAVFNRPFGFLAVHRSSGLVLTAGWVAQARPHVEASGW